MDFKAILFWIKQTYSRKQSRNSRWKKGRLPFWNELRLAGAGSQSPQTPIIAPTIARRWDLDKTGVLILVVTSETAQFSTIQHCTLVARVRARRKRQGTALLNFIAWSRRSLVGILLGP